MFTEDAKRAVALRYDLAKDAAPVVVARGERLMAQRIIEEAMKLGLHIVVNRQLSEELIKLEVKQEIPPDLYRAVAEIIAFVYNMEQRRVR